MSNPLERQLCMLSDLLDGRTLAYFGLRGSDATSLAILPELKMVACYLGPSPNDSVHSYSLESLRGSRMNGDTFHIDIDTSQTKNVFRQQLVSAIDELTYFVSYAPTLFIEDLCRSTRAHTLGISRSFQQKLEDKSIVERELIALGTPTLVQHYLRATDIDTFALAQSNTPLVVRPLFGSGGRGIELLHSVDDLVRLNKSETYAVSKYLDRSLPLNVSGVVWNNKSISLHPISVQLIGITGCTVETFGFCGNDFGASQQLPENTVKEVERIAYLVGNWLASAGYIGAFGVDLLEHEGKVLFVELNPRLQGSSFLSAELSMETGLPGVVIEHAAAVAGGSPTQHLTLLEQRGMIAAKSQLILHQAESGPGALWGDESNYEDIIVDLIPDALINVESGAISARFRFAQQITETGYSVNELALSCIRRRSNLPFLKPSDRPTHV